jgi:hypothetical protein
LYQAISYHMESMSSMRRYQQLVNIM